MFLIDRKEITKTETVGYMVLHRNKYTGHWGNDIGWPIKVFNRFYKARTKKHDDMFYEGIRHVDHWLLHFFYPNLKDAISQAKGYAKLSIDLRHHIMVVRCIIPKNAIVYFEDTFGFGKMAATEIVNIIDIPIVFYIVWKDGMKVLEQ